MDLNTTNRSYDVDLPLACTGASTYLQVVSTLIFVLVWPFIAFDFKWFPLGRPGSALVGGLLMGVFVVLTQEGIYAELGKQNNLQTLYLLVGMMFLAHFYEREGLLRILALWIFGREAAPFKFVLWKVCLLGAALSAIITNDAACVVLTPLLLKEHASRRRPRSELAPLLLGLATSANIGSASTYFGNPQNAFIAASSDGRISLVLFFAAALPAAIVGLLLSVGVLYACYFRTVMGTTTAPRGGWHRLPASDDSNVRLSNLIQGAGGDGDETLGPAAPATGSGGGGSEPGSVDEDGNVHRHQLGAVRLETPPPPREPCPANGGGLPADEMEPCPANGGGLPADEMESTIITTTTTTTTTVAVVTWLRGHTKRQLAFIVWLPLVTLFLVILLAIPPNINNFNSGLIPLAAAIFTLLVDSILNRSPAYDAMMKVDWTVILLFSGLFVWLEGFQVTCFPARAFNAMRKAMNICSISGVLLFTVFVAVGSNILSNVPLVVLIARFLPDFDCPSHSGSDEGDVAFRVRVAGMLLAWVSTIAGNFTLIGSVANLIVAEKALKVAGFRLTFWEYIKFGGISTLIVTLSGLPVVYFIATIVKG